MFTASTHTRSRTHTHTWCPKCKGFAKYIVKYQRNDMCKKVQSRRMVEGESILWENAIKTKITNMWPRSRKGDQIHVLGTSLNGKWWGHLLHPETNQESEENMGWILKTENESPKTMGRFYMKVVQSVLLYGSESWVIGTSSWKMLNSCQCARHMVGRHIIHLSDDTWELSDF